MTQSNSKPERLTIVTVECFWPEMDRTVREQREEGRFLISKSPQASGRDKLTFKRPERTQEGKT